MKRVLAFDFGASSGRAIIGALDGGKITLTEVHRFTNDPVRVNGTLYWDTLRLFYEIKQGIIKAKLAGGFDSIGIDTWGVDFGLIDEHGCLLENPIHYRDSRTKGMIEELFKALPREEVYGITGIQFMELNTVYQLLSLKKQRPHILDRADKLLFTPDLFSYLLTGEKVTEYSIATTSQLVDVHTHDWSDKILDAIGVDRGLFAPMVPSGTVVAELSEDICEECGVSPVPVIAVCGHDTQSAITAVPCPEGDFAFISSGTWSLFGTEIPEPIVNEKALEINITNEGGYGDTTGFLKNIVGLWLIQESRRQWRSEGMDYSYADLERLALEAPAFKRFVDPDLPELIAPGDIPGRVRNFCRRTGQQVPQTVGEVMRCIYESLAMKYKHTFDSLSECTGRSYPAIHVIGGGTKDTFLCRLTANACGVPVKAGPVEATVLGNVAIQFIAGGEIGSIEEARGIIARSSAMAEYAPEDTELWQKAYGQYLKIVGK